MAEREGFEPPERARRSTDFESAPFDHSGTSPFLIFQYVIDDTTTTFFAGVYFGVYF